MYDFGQGIGFLQGDLEVSCKSELCLNTIPTPCRSSLKTIHREARKRVLLHGNAKRLAILQICILYLGLTTT